MENQKTSGLAVASLILGICGFFIPFVCSLLAIIFAFIALSKIKKNPEEYKGKGLAVAGLTLGMISIVIFLLIVLAGIIMAWGTSFTRSMQ